MSHKEFYKAGLTTIPIGDNKQPLVKWQNYIKGYPTDKAIERFDSMKGKYGLINGMCSGNVLTIDFDDVDAFNEFKRLVVEYDAKRILAKCVVVKSPHGYHVRFRSSGNVAGNKVLARGTDKQTLIETRGEGGYCLLPPSEGYTYVTSKTDLAGIVILSEEEEEQLLSFCYSLDCCPKSHVEEDEKEFNEEGRSGDVYNRVGHEHFMSALQEDAGWELVSTEEEKTYWRRAGKTDGISATFNHEGSGLFHVFSSNVPNLDAGAYTMFTAFTKLLYNGNFEEAAVVLASAGYGSATNGDYKEFNSLETHEVPEFPVEIFPKWASNYLNDVANSTQTPVDLGAMLLLALGGACIARKVYISPKEDWKEPTCLYTSTFANPAARKSPVFDRIMKPFLDHQNRVNNMSVIDRRVQASRKRALSNKIDMLEKKMGDMGEDEFTISQELIRTAYEQMENIGNTEPAVYACDDVTIEKLADLLENNGSRMAMFSDEAGIFEQIGGKYSNKSLDLYLKGYSGGNVTVHRIGRPANVINNAHITIGITVQPIVLENLGKNSDLEQRGVLGRFLYSYPLSNVGTRLGRGSNVNQIYQREYEENIYNLADTRYRTIPATSEKPERLVPTILKFSIEAENRYWQFQEQVEKSMGTNGEMEYLPSWTGKIMGNLARVCAILHCMEQIEIEQEDIPEVIPISTVEKALSLYIYLKEHAKKIYYYLSSDKDLRLAIKITKYFISEQFEEISRRDLHHHFQTACPRSTDLDGPLKMLEDRGYIKKKRQDKHKGRPTEVYEINPLMLEHYKEDTAKYLG